MILLSQVNDFVYLNDAHSHIVSILGTFFTVT